MNARNVAVFCSLALCFVLTECTHFRSAITRITSDPGNPLHVSFDLEVAWRRSYPVSEFYPRKNPGDTLNYGTWYFDDGTSTPIAYTISTANLEEDWIMGRFVVNKTYDSATKFDGSPYRPYFSGCCRISELHNAPDTDYLVELEFDGNPRSTANGGSKGNNSPVVGTNPLVRVTNEEVWHYKILAFDPDDDPITFRLGTPDECGSGHVQPTNFLLNTTTGEITWDVINLPLGLWNACIRVSDGYSEIGLDFLLHLRERVKVCSPECGNVGQICQSDDDCCIPDTCVPNAHPEFIAPTPTEGTVLTAYVGEEVVVHIAAKDNNTNDELHIFDSVVPVGAKFDPQNGTNPVTTVLRWTPTMETNEVVCIAAFDQHGLGIKGGQLCFVFHVVIRDPTCSTDIHSCRNRILRSPECASTSEYGQCSCLRSIHECFATTERCPSEVHYVWWEECELDEKLWVTNYGTECDLGCTKPPVNDTTCQEGLSCCYDVLQCIDDPNLSVQEACDCNQQFFDCLLSAGDECSNTTAQTFIHECEYASELYQDLLGDECQVTCNAQTGHACFAPPTSEPETSEPETSVGGMNYSWWKLLGSLLLVACNNM